MNFFDLFNKKKIIELETVIDDLNTKIKRMEIDLGLKDQDWKLVYVLPHKVTINSTKNSSGNLYFKFYEDRYGQRKIKYTTDIPNINSLEFIVMQMEIYHTKVSRWAEGRFDPDIPKYADIPAEEMLHALKGSIE